MAANRPVLVTIIALLTMLYGIILILLGTVALIASTLDAVFDIFDVFVDIIGFGLIVAGVIFFIIGYGLWDGWTPMWYIALVIYAISAGAAIVSLASTLIKGGDAVTFSMVIPLIIDILILYYLFRPKVKEFFDV